MNKKITSDILFTGSGGVLENGVVVIDQSGQILEVASREKYPSVECIYYPGFLMPGMINTHCHLELSHLKGKVDTGTGLLPFLNKVVTLRDVDPEVITQAIANQDQYMFDQGIVAVGDICNTADTLVTKLKSRIHYHSFVEMFDFMKDSMTEQSYQQYLEVYQSFARHALRFVATPHAPYTVSTGLFQKINALNKQPSTISLHNQETVHENALFKDGSGGFPAFFEQFGIDFSDFRPTGRTSLEYAMQHMDPHHKTLLVHNTLSTQEDVARALAWNEQVFWVTCPNANLYIENRLPDYKALIEAGATLTIGTDSLTSNWQLSVLEEMKTIQRYNSYITTNQLVQWATWNGAKALGIEDQFGSMEAGKSPGIIWVQTNRENVKDLTQARRVVRVDR